MKSKCITENATGVVDKPTIIIIVKLISRVDLFQGPPREVSA